MKIPRFYPKVLQVDNNNRPKSMDSKQQKQFLNLPFEVKQINDEDPKFFFFEGYASTFGNIDRVDDIVVKGAFEKSLVNRPNIKVLFNHDSKDLSIGKVVEAKEDDIGLFVRVRLSKRVQLAKDVAALIEDEVIDTMSIGYFIKESDYRDDGIRLLKEIDLFEVSPVNFEANSQAVITSKSIDELETIKDIETSLKERGYSNNESKTLISKIKELSKQRDVEEKQQEQRDAETKRVLDEIQNLTQYIKTIK